MQGTQCNSSTNLGGENLKRGKMITLAIKEMPRNIHDNFTYYDAIELQHVRTYINFNNLIIFSVMDVKPEGSSAVSGYL